MQTTKTHTPRIALAALFITSLVTAQLIAVKVLALPLPFSLPVVGGAIIVPAGVLAYALTFFASDCYAELYGRRDAQAMVNIGFVMNFAWLGLLWLAIQAPASPAGVAPEPFRQVLGLSTNIVIGSLTAYIVSQNWDVVVFHAIGDYTDGKFLWLRNMGSTSTSQLIDTVIFVGMAFFVVPSLLGLGQALPAGVLLQLIVGQYILKLLIALVDTPFVYGVVRLVRSNGWVESRWAPAD